MQSSIESAHVAAPNPACALFKNNFSIHSKFAQAVATVINVCILRARRLCDKEIDRFVAEGTAAERVKN